MRSRANRSTFDAWLERDSEHAQVVRPSVSLAEREAIPEARRPIAVFDSGLGGLTVVRELSAVMPGEDIYYFGDTARVPYGIKSPETIQRFSLEIASFLMQFSPKMLVVACNTASATAIDVLESRCPVEVVDVIRPSAAAAVENGPGIIGVIGTEATIQSGAYPRAIHQLDPERTVRTACCPLLVPIVEEGRSEDDPIVLNVLTDYLREMQRDRPASLVLGCTHYPLLRGAIAKLMGPKCHLINSGQAAAKEVQRRLSLRGRQASRPYGGRLRCFTTDNEARFARLGERFGARRIDQVEYVATEQLEAAYRQFQPGLTHEAGASET